MSASVPEPSHGEIQDLLGVYALDALDAETATMVERHLEGCPRCSTEVAQHHEVAGLLANSGGASPAKLWDGIASQLDGSTPPSWESLSARLETGSDRTDLMSKGGTDVVPFADRRRRRWVAWTAGAVAAAAAVVAVVLGFQVRHLDHQVNSLQAPLSAAERSALGSPTTRQVELVAAPGPAGAASERATVVLTESGTGFVQAQGLSRLPGDETYQLWGVVGRKTISLGLLGARPEVIAFSVAGAPPVSAFAITAEQSGGVVRSNHQPVVAGEVHA
ncbi:MAG TPA: anti-sigma factor [Acidimicrobiales bacterium]|nr:anti-sigma factor [Acidimicrobiales bacterium]